MSPNRSISFDGWVLRTDVGELVKDGRKIRLQDQPLQILDELLSRPGELVTREQLIARLWPKGVVDFDTGLNSAIRKLRVALRDEAETPRYIETIPRKGYRFIGTIDPPVAAEPPLPGPGGAITSVGSLPPADSSPLIQPSTADPGPSPIGTGPAAVATGGGAHRHTRPIHIYVSAGVVALLVAGLIAFGSYREPLVTRTAPAHEVASGDRSIAVLPFIAAATDESSVLLAQSIADLIRTRLESLNGWTVIATASTSRLTDAAQDNKAVAEKLRTRFLLKGSAARTGNQLRVEVQLLDAARDLQLWSSAFNRSVADVNTLRDEILQRVARALQVPSGTAASRMAAGESVDLDAYQLYVRGQQLIANLRVDDATAAIELFRRSTTLDPGFARGYLALAQAYLLASALGDSSEAALNEMHAAASAALDRALELNPSFGEAVIERARLTRDPSKAEPLFRRGLESAPNYGMGYMRYAEFLFGEYRKGEAIQMMERARQIDPLNPRLHIRQAFFTMVGFSNVAEHDRLLREALAISPKFPAALGELAHSQHDYTGDFAEGIRLMEQTIALDPQSTETREYAAIMYLDVDDPEAAAALLAGENRPSMALIELAQYRRDRSRAAELARMLPDGSLWSSAAFSSPADAIRDEAIATGDYASALKLLESRYALVSPTPGSRGGMRMWDRGLALVYAHTLILAGEAERGRKLLTAILVQIDSESVGRTEHWFARERAMAYTLLGDDERALQELAASLKLGHYARWWYTAELNPIYDHLRHDPRFQALAAQGRKHRLEQRALVDVMREKGDIPRRAVRAE